MLTSRNASTRVWPSPKCIETCSTQTSGTCTFASPIILSCHRSRWICLDCQTDAETACDEANRDRHDKQSRDDVGDQDDPSGKVVLELQHQRQADKIAANSHRQGLLDDETHNRSIWRSDQLQRCNRSHFIHGERIDDQSEDYSRYAHQQGREHLYLLLVFFDDEHRESFL